MSEYGFIVDTMRWSYSRLNSYHTCAYGFQMQYIECVESENNFFGQYGKFMHSILEKYSKCELDLFSLSQYYEDNYDIEITLEAPHNKYTDIRQYYYNKGLEYLNNIDFILDSYDILGVEKEIKFKIGKYDFIGYIDLLLRDKKNGGIIIIDHKSANIKFLKSGKVSKTDFKHIEEFKHQLYLYSMAIYNEYNEFPKLLKWNLFNNQTWLCTKFNNKKYKKSLKWAYKTITLIENEVMWLPNPQFYFCHNICGFRNKACPYKANK